MRKLLIPVILILGGCLHHSVEVVIPETGSPFAVWGVAPEEMAEAGMDIVNAECRLDGQRQLAENIASFLRSRSKLYFEAHKVFEDPVGVERLVKSITVNLVALHLSGISTGNLMHDTKNDFYRLLVKIDPKNIGEISKSLMKKLFHENSEYLDTKTEEEIERLNEDISRYFLDEAVRIKD